MRVVVLTGAGGKAFVSGADISKFENERSNEEAIARYNATVERANAAIYDYPEADHRHDPRLLHRRRRRACAVLRPAHLLGQFALRACRPPSSASAIGYPGLKKLVDVVGPSFAKEIFYTARQFDAEEARVMGLVNRVVAGRRTRELREEICRHDRRERAADHR